MHRQVEPTPLPIRSGGQPQQPWQVRLAKMRLAKKGGSMQIIWMVLVTLVLALTGILGLALVTRIAAWARRRDPQPKP